MQYLNTIHVDLQSSAGGVAVYVSDKFKCNPCSNLCIMPSSEYLWLKLSRANSTEKFIVGTIYRHPNQSTLKNFLDSFSECLNDLSILKKFYNIGDFNINIQKFKRTNEAHDYINLIVGN